MKLLVETAGSFQLLGDERGQFIPHNRPCVQTSSHFVQRFQLTEKVRLLGQVNDDATDEEFAKYWTESEQDHELAVASFLAAFPVDPPAPKKASTKAKELAE